MAKKIPPRLTSLGRQSLPEEIEVQGHRYKKTRIFKNDFFAITAMYENILEKLEKSDKIILKVHRRASFYLIPMCWIGKILASREQVCFERLADVQGIPKFIGRWEKTGIIREFIEGHPLEKREKVSDPFHAQLRTIIDHIHSRNMAYVDLEKSENVLVGDDHRPYLFDFQIAWIWPAKWGGNLWPATALRRWFQTSDHYHLIKLQRRTRPDQLSDQQLKASYHKPWYIRWHGILTYPLMKGRRKILNRIDPKRAGRERGRVST